MQDDSHRGNRSTIASADLSQIRPGWTVYDALDRPVGNATDFDGGHLRIDGRPEGLGYFTVPVDAIRELHDGGVYLRLEIDRLAAPEFAAAPPLGTASPEEETGMNSPSQPTYSGTPTPTAMPSHPLDRPEPAAARREQTHGSSFTASGTPVGQGSNTPTGDEPDSYRRWDEDLEGSSRSKLAMLAAPVGIGAASAAAYAWWRKRQARRSRLALLTQALTTAGGLMAPALASAGGSMAPLLAAARNRKRGWWLASLAALPLAYLLRPRPDYLMLEAPPDTPHAWDWRQKLQALELTRPEVAPPSLWTAAIPIIGAGLAAAWYAARGRGSTPGRSARGSRTIRQAMTRDAQVIRPEASVFEAATLMRRLDVGFLPVCDGRRLQGVLTDRDIVLRPIADSRDPQVTPVRDAMSAEVVYAFDDDPLDHAAELMRRHQIRRLPIVDRAKNLVGVLSLGDLATESNNDRLSGETLERISEPARPRR